MTSEDPYVEERDDRYYARGSRVPLTGLALLWLEGASPETIQENYPVLSLAQVYGALAFYLQHREVIDRHEAEDRANGDAAITAQALANADTALRRRRSMQQ